MVFSDFLDLVRKYNSIVIYRHKNPDGDAIGSQVGLKHLILDNFEGKTVLCPGDMPGKYLFMKDSEPDIVPDAFIESALAVVLDTSSEALISDDRWRLAADTVRIDHHLFINQICRLEIVDSTFESCCGLIAELAMSSGLKISVVSASSLFTGMVTDSGRFRYDSVNARTFELASFLMRSGIDIQSIYNELYSEPFSTVKFKSEFISKIRFSEHGVAYVYTTENEVKASGRSAYSISRGMVGTMADIKGCNIWVNFTESDGVVLAEIRSSSYNINPVAVKYGGGGHSKASGATIKNREEAQIMLNDLDLLALNASKMKGPRKQR